MKTAEELKTELNVFQLCIANYVEYNLELNVEVQISLYIALFSLDFTVIDIGGLTEVFTDDFKASLPTEIDFNGLVANNTFITLTTLIDVLVVMQSRGNMHCSSSVSILDPTNSSINVFNKNLR